MSNHKAVLKELLKGKYNRYCVDCSARNPTWASVNLGIFLCIRCAGIHRKMGTHISKVRSVELDTWQRPFVETMISVGNLISNQYFEHKIEPGKGMKPNVNTDVHKLEQFIRNKYMNKLWAMEVPVKKRTRPAPVVTPSNQNHRRNRGKGRRQGRGRGRGNGRKKNNVIVGDILNLSNSEPSVIVKKVEKKEKKEKETTVDSEDEYEEDVLKKSPPKKIPKVSKEKVRQNAYSNVLSLMENCSPNSTVSTTSNPSPCITVTKTEILKKDEDGYEEDNITEKKPSKLSIDAFFGVEKGSTRNVRSAMTPDVIKKDDGVGGLFDYIKKDSMKVGNMGLVKSKSANNISKGDEVDEFLTGWKFENF